MLSATSFAELAGQSVPNGDAVGADRAEQGRRRVRGRRQRRVVAEPAQRGTARRTAADVGDRLFGRLTPAEREQFVDLLRRLAEHTDVSGRAEPR